MPPAPFLHFLLVENNAADVFLVREAIRQANVHADVRVAVDGEQAIHMLDDFKPDLILLDLNLPKIDGLEFLERHRQRGGPPVIVVTSSLRPQDRDQSLALGALDYVAKPRTVAEFLGTVGGAVKRWAAGRTPLSDS